jgi:hypothetical protein
MQIGNQSLKVITPTDFPAEADREYWIQPELSKLRWLDAESGAALKLNGAA